MTPPPAGHRRNILPLLAPRAHCDSLSDFEASPLVFFFLTNSPSRFGLPRAGWQIDLPPLQSSQLRLARHTTGTEFKKKKEKKVPADGRDTYNMLGWGVDGVVGSHLGACLCVRRFESCTPHKDFLTAKEHGFVLKRFPLLS